MQLAHRVSLDGVQLDEIDERIIIKSVDGGAGKETVTKANTGAGDGARITGKRRDSIEVQVKFSMNIRRNVMEERADVLERIVAWAEGCGYLRINYKPNRRIYIDEVTAPGEGDLWKRLSEYTIAFRANAIPYWEEDDAAAAIIDTTQNGSGTITVAGSARTVAECELKNMSGANINTAEITIGGKTMSFSALALAGDESLVIDHAVTEGKNVIRIRIRSAGGEYRSALGKRSAASADEFEIMPGNHAVSFSAQRACRLTVNVRGRFA